MYEEIEFDCNHFGVFENAIDMAHIHYLHGDSFGNSVSSWYRSTCARCFALLPCGGRPRCSSLSQLPEAERPLLCSSTPGQA